MAYRLRSNGQYPLQLSDVQDLFPNTLLPSVLDNAACDHLGIDPVLLSPQPSTDAIHTVVEGAPVQNSTGEWVQTWASVDITVGMDAPTLAALLARLKADKINALANFRYARETGGTTVAGQSIKTDRESQGLIGGAYSAAKDGTITSFNFKSASGWAVIPAASMVAIGQAVATYVQACFSAEMTHTNNINALTTPQAVVSYDFTTGWP